jgi:hypothetical protein
LKKAVFIFLIFCVSYSRAQKDTLPYNKKREIIFDNKRYRVYNNYLTFGAGKAYADIRKIDQSVINVDFQFHLQKENFQMGFLMSGDEFLRNTNLSAHVCYGMRWEKTMFNWAAFVGPSYSYFVTGEVDTAGYLIVTRNTELGGYICLQGVYKIKYDVGLGLQVYADINPKQKIVGASIICFFSGAYRGERRGYRPKKK